uniref:G_PROTEIN_RECEP_F1_2 domain-containing protein n=1 Tax=Strongyloides papillosus TaxID=174720 RepID=A0A0N5B2B8_STREA
MEVAAGTFVMLVERLHAFAKVEFYDELPINYLYVIILLILVPIGTFALLPFCDVFIPEIITTIYWLGCTTFAAIGLTIICWIDHRRLKIEKILKNNLNRRYALMGEQANIRLYLCFVFIQCVLSYIGYLLYILQRYNIVKKGYIRVIFNYMLCIFYVLYVSCINLIKPSVRRRMERILSYCSCKKKKICVLTAKNERHILETMEHYRQLKLMW